MARRSLTGPISMVLGYALMATTSQAAPVTAETDAFGIVDLPAGYELDRMHGEGKCGEGKCGGEEKGEAEGKCGEGKCGGREDKGKAEGKCGEGKCGDDSGKGGAEGKCGEGKCGGEH